MQKSYGKGYGIAVTLTKPLPSLLSRHPPSLPTPINAFTKPHLYHTIRLSHTPLQFMA